MKILLSDIPKRRFVDDVLEFHVSNVYQDDLLRIMQSKAYRRASFKTQVYTSPRNPHVRTRAVHTNEVIALSMVIADALGLDTNLVQAIAAGHDIGHVPFGHLGEKVLKELSGKAFHHAIFSVVVAQHIERKGRGLNLTKGVLLGILNHARGKNGLVSRLDLPQEFDLVMFADKIAYTFSDLNDVLRYGEIKKSDLPDFVEDLGIDQRARIYNVLNALVQESKEKGRISFSEGEVFQKFETLRQWMYANVYEKVNRPLQVESIKAVHEYFVDLLELKDFDPIILIALMTDMEVIDLAIQLLGSYKPVWPELRNLGFIELLPYLQNKKIDFTDPDLDW